MHRRGGRRRVTGWGPWIGIRYGIRTEAEARDDAAERRKRACLTEFAVFFKGKRVDR